MLAAHRFSEARHVAAHHRHALVFRPLTQPAALMAAGAAGVALALAVALVWRGVADGVTFAAFLSYLVAAALVAVAAVVGYWALALANLRYEIVDGALIIVWGLTRQVVPLATIERLVRGRALGLPRVAGLELPGWPCHVGRAVVLRLGEVLLYSTHRTPADILYVVTPQQVYGISPADQRGFIQALQAAVASVDALYEVRQEVVRLGPAAWPLWTDRFALLTLAAGTALALAATGVVFARYTALPAEVVLPFPQPGSVGEKRALLGVPVAAITVLLLNGGAGALLHRALRPVAYTLFLSALFIEALLLVAAVAAT